MAPIDTDDVAVKVETGAVFITAVTLMVDAQPEDGVTVQVYVPAIAEVALVETVGFCELEEKLFGPVHE